jgi:glutathione synthase/RimK-type ligase-like ATP-grasp enzyme
MIKHRLAILKNEDPFDHQPWVDACEKFNLEVEYKIIDITKKNWLSEIQLFTPEVLLLKPSGKTSLFRTLYQERVDILVNDLNYKTFPTYDEVRIYENKRFFAYWAMANKIPHPRTFVLYHKKESKDLLKSLTLPVVGKINVGASGKGIKIINSKDVYLQYINKAFGAGLSSKTGPKFKNGQIIRRMTQKILHPGQLANRLNTYKEIASDKQSGFVIIQEYIPHDFEWRVVKIGDSFFAHKKLKLGEKSSGSLLKNYDNPPLKLFDFVKKITDRFNFNSVAVDLFEANDEYLVNEIQCIFGQSDSYQMLVNDTPGRYRFINNQWIFEEGDFNQNRSYNLRLNYILSQLV